MSHLSYLVIIVHCSVSLKSLCTASYFGMKPRPVYSHWTHLVLFPARIALSLIMFLSHWQVPFLYEAETLQHNPKKDTQSSLCLGVWCQFCYFFCMQCDKLRALGQIMMFSKQVDFLEVESTVFARRTQQCAVQFVKSPGLSCSIYHPFVLILHRIRCQ